MAWFCVPTMYLRKTPNLATWQHENVSRRKCGFDRNINVAVIIVKDVSTYWYALTKHPTLSEKDSHHYHYHCDRWIVSIVEL